MTSAVDKDSRPTDRKIAHPSVVALERLFTLSGLTQNQLVSLANQVEVQVVPKGTSLVELGSDPDYDLYLLDGVVRLTADDGRESRISHTDFSARYPLAHLRPSRYQVTADSEMSCLRIDNSLLNKTRAEIQEQPTLEGYEVEVETPGAHSVENQLIYRIYAGLNNDSLVLPSLSPVAQKIGEAVEAGNDDVQELVEILSADAAIAAKLLHAVNQARSEAMVRIKTLSEAIAWLGPKRTHNLVLNFIHQDTFSSSSDNLSTHMVECWEHSRQVAAIAHVLAKMHKAFDPELALLAGLVHDLGALAIIHYARDYPAVADNARMLDEAIKKLGGQMGEMIINKWRLPVILSEVAHEAENWQREHKGPPDYVDLVIVAHAHWSISNGRLGVLPSLPEIPALAKLGFEPTADHSLELLDSARKEIEHTERMLGL